MPVALQIFCDAKVHCGDCRDNGYAGRVWRESVYLHLSPKPDSSVWECPRGVRWQNDTAPEPTPPTEVEANAQREAERIEGERVAAEKLALAGRAHWLALHAYDHIPTDAELEDWLANVPRFGCQCQAKAREYVKAHPMPRTSLDDVRLWGWEFHESVNAELGHASFPFADARALYGW